MRILGAITEVFEEGALPHQQALSLRGRLQFAKAQLWGRSAKLVRDKFRLAEQRSRHFHFLQKRRAVTAWARSLPCRTGTSTAPCDQSGFSVTCKN